MNWLFLRGWARDKDHWAHFPKHFQSSFPSARIHFLDNPGFGTESNSKSPWSVDGIRKNLRSRWLPLRAAHPEPWHLLGISLGGMIALDWVEHHPQDFESLVLINASSKDTAKPWERLRWRELPKFLKIMSTRDLQSREKQILELSANRPLPTLPFPAKKLSMKNAFRQLIASACFRSFGAPKLPCLFLSSEKDRLVDPVASTRLAQALKATQFCHPTAGHDLPLDEPEWLSKKIAQWMIETKGL